MDPKHFPARRIAWGCVALFVVLEAVVKTIVDFFVTPAVSDITRSLDVAIALGITPIGTEAATFAAFALIPIALMPAQAVAGRRETPRAPGSLGRG